MPNMSWIFTQSGIPVYKSDWTDPASVANAIGYFVDVTARRQRGERLAPFRVERLDFRTQDREIGRPSTKGWSATDLRPFKSFERRSDD
jgi:hypothetical protein